MHVLVLDDNPDDRELVKREISAVFPDASFRDDGTDWARFEAALGDASAYDLVITDYALRWTDGIAVLRRVKALRPELPVIMFTGSGDQEVAVEAMKAGLEDYSYEVGFERNNFGTESFDYGRAVASATYRRGLTDPLTAARPDLEGTLTRGDT